jgi:ubiquitin C-terminal hydrolase
MNPLFKGLAANKPKDLIIFLLENIHKELNIKKSNKNNRNNFPINNNNFIEAYNNFKESIISQNKSIISDEFYGYNNNIKSCVNCHFTINEIQVYNILSFSLEEIIKYKNNSDKIVKIIDCFEYYTNKIEFNQKFFCISCKQSNRSISQNKLINAPHILIFNLDRGKGQAFNINISLDEYLNLNKYIIDENSPYYYELIGAICLFERNEIGGHFVAFCKNYNNCEWYKYNDQIVTKCFFNEVRQSGSPYVLFYNYVQT